MLKRTQQSAKERKQQEVLDGNKAKNALFASCSFSSLGLDPKLSDQLKGSLYLSLPIPLCIEILYIYMFNELNSVHH